MRIVQLVPDLEEGGVERGVVEMNRELVARQIDNIVVSRGGKLVAEIQKHGGRHIVMDVGSKNPLTAPFRALRLRQLFHELKPSIIHARSRVPAWLCVMANRHPRFPFVTSVHASYSVNRYSRVMGAGDRVICVSEVLSSYMQENYQTDPIKITVIQRGVDMRVFDPARIDSEFVSTFKRQYGLAGRKVILSVGRISHLKDFESFIDAIAIIRNSMPEVVGLIVGGITPDKQRYFEELKRRRNQLGLKDHVVFAGSHSQMPEIYHLADVMVNASLKMSNVGRTVAEGLAMNTPVLATTEKGLRNLVHDGSNGFIINTRDPEDLAEKVIRGLALERKGIRETVPEEYTLAHMAEQTLTVYRDLLTA
ncbi:MAG: glycosyltransferase [Gammaproteobacteria bacterium]|nr:glycosyltransferase [Gammaproteobacteria bacterium]NIN37257.1 glycosyltransferase [Gammaproteobacteria bacterium]NIO26115.1 glycosyltransferase [Gammaproteobacteria bacterium]NIO66728.1 glycosyltransferase [Gammaproteobacteria bacterium]NIP65881.1 glycosyltransferase [Gammaproteobacteria bacterium]